MSNDNLGYTSKTWRHLLFSNTVVVGPSTFPATGYKLFTLQGTPAEFFGPDSPDAIQFCAWLGDFSDRSQTLGALFNDVALTAWVLSAVTNVGTNVAVARSGVGAIPGIISSVAFPATNAAAATGLQTATGTPWDVVLYDPPPPTPAYSVPIGGLKLLVSLSADPITWMRVGLYV